VSGLTKQHDQPDLGSTRLMAEEQGPVGRLRPGTWELATQHGELVAQDEDLQILGGIAAAE
jgi:hypothetical protein